MKLYDINDIAQISGYSLPHIYYTIHKKKIKENCILKRKKYYTEEQISEILRKNTVVIEKYYPLKTTETFYIYESKMNGL